MTRNEFIHTVSYGLHSLDECERNKAMEFYLEIIDDAVESGKNENDAIEELGSIQKIISDILEDSKDIPQEQKNNVEFQSENVYNNSDSEYHAATVRKSMPVWAVILLIVGSPIWLSLLIAAFSVVLSLAVSVFAVILLLFASSFFLCAAGIISIVCSIIYASAGGTAAVIFITGCSIASIAFGILLGLGTYYILKAVISLIKYIYKKIKGGKNKRGLC